MDRGLDVGGEFRSLMQHFAVAAHTHWHDPLEPGFDVRQSIPQSPYEGVGHLSELCTFGRMTGSLQLSDSTRICGWCVSGLRCNELYPLGDNLEAYHFAAYQLASYTASGKETRRYSLVRIIRPPCCVHLHIATACKACGASLPVLGSSSVRPADEADTLMTYRMARVECTIGEPQPLRKLVTSLYLTKSSWRSADSHERHGTP